MSSLRTIELVGVAIIAALIVSCSFNQFVSATASPGESAATSSLYSPWVQKAHQYKGQLHCQTTKSGATDSLTPSELVRAYKSEGFNFVVITDHDHVTTTAEITPPVPGILTIKGIEQSGVVPGTTANIMHYTAINAKTAHFFKYAQDGINAHERDGVTVLSIAHPWWHLTNHAQTAQMISRIHGLTLMDIYNAAMYDAYWYKTTDTTRWDDYLTHYGRLWGIAVDDFHYNYDLMGSGYVVINADSLTVPNVLAALKSGNFYSVSGSNGAGPGIKSITVVNNQISVVATNAATIKWYVANGRLARQSNTGSDSYTPTGTDEYVRIEAVSATGTAWSQPIYEKPLPASTTTLTASGTTPPVNQKVTFTATLKSGTTPLSGKSVTIYHYLGSTRYDDTTKITNANGQITLTQKFGSPGKRTYYATFAGDSSYASSTSSVVTVIVKAQTKIILTASTAAPAVNQKVTFTATLKSGIIPLSSKRVTIYHYIGTSTTRYTDTTKTTNANGQITFTQSFGSAGQRQYYATFGGDGTYFPSESSRLTISVH